jgi:hypothetical protein
VIDAFFLLYPCWRLIGHWCIVSDWIAQRKSAR